ncbi:MAG: class I SAM-dependent methyltransferase [Candidatus Levyibacteriota bacterium]|nr:MAG: class I SAM-dependent methyltransferase [Candidatus Levybacteria bacterium]
MRRNDILKANKKWWNDVTPIHAKSKLYNLASFKKGKTSLEKTEITELGNNVRGKTLLHPMCHFGMDTLSWARKGAITTGVDLSDKAIEFAKELSKETHIPSTFICSDFNKLPKALNKKFDIIFMSYGVLCWITDINKWAKIISHFLKKGGTFYIIELHPFTNILSYDFKISYNYFDKGPDIDDSEGTYADWNAPIKSPTYVWSYTISNVINALTQQGLKIEYVHEFPFTMYDQFPGFMKINEKNQYVLKNKKIQIPLLFSIKATKQNFNTAKY